MRYLELVDFAEALGVEFSDIAGGVERPMRLSCGERNAQVWCEERTRWMCSAGAAVFTGTRIECLWRAVLYVLHGPRDEKGAEAEVFVDDGTVRIACGTLLHTLHTNEREDKYRLAFKLRAIASQLEGGAA